MEPSNLLFFYQNVHRQILNNGLTVLLYPAPGSSIINYQLWVKTGSANEGQYLGTGMSHCLEHSVFLGSKKFSKSGQCSQFIEMRGGADNNAHTSYEHTAFHFSLNKDFLSDGLLVLSDTVFCPLFPRKKFFKEKKVILAEMDMDLDDPEIMMSQDFMEKIYPNHPYGVPIIGYRDSFVELTLDEIWSYFEKKYVPNNMVLALAGDFEVDKAVDLIAKHFGSYRRKNYSPSENLSNSIASAWDFPPMTLNLEVPRVKMSFSSCDILSDDAVVLDLIDVILSYEKNSYFYKKYLLDNSLNHIETNSWTPKQTGCFEITLSGSKEQLKDKRAVIMENLKTFISELAEEDIEGAKSKLYRDITLNLESLIASNQILIASESFTGNFHFEYDYLSKLKGISRSDLMRATEKYFCESKLIYREYHPSVTKTQLSKVSSQTNREKTALTSTPNACQKFYLDNGLTVVYKNEPIQNIHLNLIFKGGLEYEREADNGLFPLLAAMILQGTKDQTEIEIARFFENLGCLILPFSYESSFGFTLSFLKRDEKKVYEKLVEIISSSIFHENKLEILKQKTIEDLKLDKESLWQTHSHAFRDCLFKNSILRLNIRGDEDSLKKIKNKKNFRISSSVHCCTKCLFGFSGKCESNLSSRCFLSIALGKTH